MESIGRMIISLGILLIIIGGVITLGGKLGLGRLPGDIYIKKGNFTFYFPLLTSIIISIVLTFLSNLIFRR
ncbi:Protein of unknown function [Caminicella sporogenes DSM 14501]|uniref:DUF2905 domain-containing protein n=1 Tax=Caminicella sporogenes DSM 14501 TaxID=1121266 RepID=A0A1M6M1W3_9FIRM|nr:DUF2905 domain-containing protein [Caminicella sporogenes]RKD28033.1 hypothetical protein BET04_02955 [Caminicella sporogenes]WIF94360.1 DUF2905 domain-containing protein [Caminicella sporogenes]SHJ77442.1 Protein of unknown function [Caminicella sporogenes DSM 14501]